MSFQVESPKVPLRMRRSQNALPKITTSSPSATSPTDPQTSKEHSHRPHHHHWYGRDTIQSAIQLQNPFSFQDILKQHSSKNGSRTPGASNSASRRPSVYPKKDTGEDAAALRPATLEDVFKERAKAKMREDELRGSLQELSDHSFKSTRQLDETYYSILERTAQIRTTITALQELYGLTTELHNNFKNEVSTLEDEMQGQIDGLQASEQQHENVEQLRTRIEAGKDKADLLRERLEKAGRRIDARELRDFERQALVNRRLRILWSVLGFILGLFLLLLLSHNFLLPKKLSALPEFGGNISAELENATIPAMAKDDIINAANRPTFSRASQQPSKSSRVVPDDNRLRALDEL